MSILPDWLPNIHPFVVHFPIALLVLAVVSELFSLILKKYSWLKTTTTFLYGVGGLLVIITYITGGFAADSVVLSASSGSLVGEHSDWAFYTTIFFVTLISLRITLEIKLPSQNKFKSTVFLFGGFVGLFLLFETAEQGGKLVYQEGVGVIAVSKLTSDLEEAINRLPVDPGIIEDSKGVWTWRPAAGAEKVLQEQFTWITNSYIHLHPSVEIIPKIGSVLALRPDGMPVIFVTGESLNKLQIDVSLQLSDFSGTFMVIHHFKDRANYDFMTLKNGRMKLGRMENGSEKVFDENPYDIKNSWLNIAVYGSDGHFRGIQNGKNVTHGHAEDLDAGKYGFGIFGSGTIYIQKIKIQSIN